MRISFFTRYWKGQKIKNIFFNKEDSTFFPTQETRISNKVHAFIAGSKIGYNPTPAAANIGKALNNFIIHPDFAFIHREEYWCVPRKSSLLSPCYGDVTRWMPTFFFTLNQL
jgi:hypothetical protein